MLEQTLLLTGCSSILFFDLHSFPKHSQLDHTLLPPPLRETLV